MAKFQWNPLQTGGNFIQGNSAVFDFTDNLDLQDNHTVKVMAPNLTSLSRQVALSYTEEAGYGINKKPWFKGTNGDWVQENDSNVYELADVKGTIIVVVPRLENGKNYFSVYLCKDEAEKLTIPNYGVIPAIETRVASSITTANFDSWRRGQGNIHLVVTRVPIPFNDETKTYADTVAAVKSGDKIRITSSAINSLQDFDADLPLAVVGQTVTTGSTIIYDLDERVTILETEMADIGTEMQKLSSEISNLRGKVNDVLTATSKFYVSR